jgi:two-component system sensor histidine kinase BarA
MDIKLHGLPFSARIFLSIQSLLVVISLFFIFFEALYLSPQKQLIQLDRVSNDLATQLQLISPLSHKKISTLLAATSRYGADTSNIDSVIIDSVIIVWQDQQWRFDRSTTAIEKNNRHQSITSSSSIFSLDSEKSLGELTISAKKQYRLNYILAYSIALIAIIISLYSTLSFQLAVRKKNTVFNTAINTVTISEQQEQNLAHNESEKSELFLAKKSALEANRVKSTIIANTSHELLTPLNSIVGFSKILLDKKINAEQQDNFLQRINDNALHLSALVNDLLDFSIRSNRMLSLNYQATDIHALLMSITNTMAYEAQSKDLSFIADFDNLYGYEVHTDPLRLRQLISNLAINAIRYTHSGHVKITADLESETNNNHSEKTHQENKKTLVLSIEDTGIGIAKDQQKNIFSSFVSSTKSTNKIDQNPGLGLGLGLSIVSTILQRMGATIEIDSQLGNGSRFDIRMPIKQYEMIETDKKPAAISHVLLTGEYAPALDTLEERLQKISTKVTRAYDAKAHIKADFIVFNACKNTVDQLNNTDLNAIASLIDLNKPLYITAPIGLTIHNKAILSNSNIHIINGPFAIQSLLNLNTQKANNNNSNTEIHHHVTTNGDTPLLKTLVVDDNLSNIELLSLMLSHFQCDVDSATNGQDALLLLEKNDYDWLFIDIRMQPMDGISLVKAIRQLEHYQSTPIIACTAHTSDEEFRLLIDAGFDKVTYKPIMEKQIIRLKDIIFESALSGNHSSPKPTPIIFDIQYAIDKAAGNPKIALRVFNLFLKELNQAVKDKKTIMDQSPETIIDFIHKLHGAAAMTGANALKNQLNQCETLLKNSLGVLNTSSSTDLTYNTKEAINEALQEVYHQIALVLDWHKNNNMDSTFKTQ